MDDYYSQQQLVRVFRTYQGNIEKEKWQYNKFKIVIDIGQYDRALFDLQLVES